MIDCLILGDSIGVGLHQYRPECYAYARSGINSWAWNQTWTRDMDADTVVISLGTNDGLDVDTEAELRKLRDRVHARKVIWILPVGNMPARDAIKGVAKAFADWTIEIPSTAYDHVHPDVRGYQQLSSATK